MNSKIIKMLSNILITGTLLVANTSTAAPNDDLKTINDYVDSLFKLAPLNLDKFNQKYCMYYGAVIAGDSNGGCVLFVPRSADSSCDRNNSGDSSVEVTLHMEFYTATTIPNSGSVDLNYDSRYGTDVWGYSYGPQTVKFPLGITALKAWCNPTNDLNRTYTPPSSTGSVGSVKTKS